MPLLQIHVGPTRESETRSLDATVKKRLCAAVLSYMCCLRRKSTLDTDDKIQSRLHETLTDSQSANVKISSRTVPLIRVDEEQATHQQGLFSQTLAVRRLDRTNPKKRVRKPPI